MTKNLKFCSGLCVVRVTDHELLEVWHLALPEGFYLVYTVLFLLMEGLLRLSDLRLG